MLYRELPFADLELTVHDKPVDSWPEAGWICLPFKVASPQFRLGRPGSIIDPATDILSGANRHLLAINTGLSVTEGSGVQVTAFGDNPDGAGTVLRLWELAGQSGE